MSGILIVVYCILAVTESENGSTAVLLYHKNTVCQRLNNIKSKLKEGDKSTWIKLIALILVLGCCIAWMYSITEDWYRRIILGGIAFMIIIVAFIIAKCVFFTADESSDIAHTVRMGDSKSDEGGYSDAQRLSDEEFFSILNGKHKPRSPEILWTDVRRDSTEASNTNKGTLNTYQQNYNTDPENPIASTEEIQTDERVFDTKKSENPNATEEKDKTDNTIKTNPSARKKLSNGLGKLSKQMVTGVTAATDAFSKQIANVATNASSEQIAQGATDVMGKLGELGAIGADNASGAASALSQVFQNATASVDEKVTTSVNGAKDAIRNGKLSKKVTKSVTDVMNTLGEWGNKFPTNIF